MSDCADPTGPNAANDAETNGEEKTLSVPAMSHASDEAHSDSGTDTDGPIVELRTPRYARKRKDKTKRFQLFLSYPSSDEDYESSSSVEIGRVRVVPSLRGDRLQTPDLEEEEECTSDNWKVFFKYSMQLSNGGSFVLSQSSDFDNKKPTDPKPLELSKFSNGAVRLAIRSPYLRKQFKKVVDIENYNGVALTESETLLSSPFVPLFHHVEDMKSNTAVDPEATTADRSHMDALHYFATTGWPASLYNDVRSKIPQGFITYDELWALFKPGDFAVSKDPIGHRSLFKITAVKLEQEPNRGYTTEYRWWVTLVKITWKAGRFWKFQNRRRIERFADAKRIKELDFYPLSHHDSGDELREEAIRRGKAWKKYNQGEPAVMSYEGQALSMTIEIVNNSNRVVRIGEDDQSEYNSLNLLSAVIVDPGATSKAIIQASIDEKQTLWHYAFYDGGVVRNDEITEFTDEEFAICPASITVYSLDDNDWYSVDVGRLKDKEWRPKSFDRLVLDQDRKDTLIRLAKTNSKLIQSNKSKDVIEGKGKGVVLLLHGPPGVGKTLTAEVLSEYTKRPLLKVNLGRVASHKKWEQSLERIFANAEDWKAILLIDEAEIVLEKRTFERMTQNSWISVFLRKLEYYAGILILTTNLVDCIDEAFESRISYPLRFRELSREDRHQIWSDFIKAMKMLPAYKTTLLNEVDRWSEAEINGRQIRNVIMMAENLATSDEEHPRLMPKHVDELLNVTLEFCDYNQSNAARLKKIQFSGPSY